MDGWISSWRARHQHPLCRVLHAVGVPLTVLAGLLIILQLRDDAWDLWWRPVVLFVVGYGLQWIGHRIEGNNMGEVILIKRVLRKPGVPGSRRSRRGVASESGPVGESKPA